MLVCLVISLSSAKSCVSYFCPPPHKQKNKWQVYVIFLCRANRLTIENHNSHITAFSLTEQFFNVPTIIAMVLAGILFICAVAILLVSLHLKRRWYATAKKQVTDRGAKDSPFSAENTENTIIMEEMLQECGHTISLNGNSPQ